MIFLCIIFLGLLALVKVFLLVSLDNALVFPDYRSKLIAFLESSEEYYASRVRVASFIMHNHLSMTLTKIELIGWLYRGALALAAVSVFTGMLSLFVPTDTMLLLSIIIVSTIAALVVIFMAFRKFYSCVYYLGCVDSLAEAFVEKKMQVTVNGKWVGNCDCVPYLKKFDQIAFKTKTAVFTFTVVSELVANPTDTFIQIMKED